ncbi:MAG: glycoside hydrolase family 3 C-terminal domain-containing protein [bacterium]|nr:glycoside hydrolase family 3 C-terminal domain-containing protein [bacterium]
MKRLLALTTAAALAVSGMAIPAYAADYGIASIGTDGSVTLNFGADSITQKGGGSIIDDIVNNVKRPDNLKTDDSNTAVLTLPEIDLNGTGYTKVDLYAASKNDAAVTIKVGDTEVASYANVNSGAWDSYAISTANLTTAEASGNVTLNITGTGAKAYCGNYVYVRFYGDGNVVPPAVPTVQPTEKPEGLLPYQDESLSFEERAADLVSRMTLEEKVAQLGYTAPAIPRLGVANYNYWKECLHGVARQGKATNFPAPLALSNTWNRELVHSVADITSTEARGKNNKTNLSYYTPTINMARDPRWGRNEETYGEDPYLTGQLGGEFVKGMQGDDEKYVKIIATIKHFAANNNEANRRGGSSIMNEYNFRNYYLKVFRNVAEIEMPGSVMSSYNATSIYRDGNLLFNYKPSAANTYLLTDILRRTWGFDGYVTTDCGAGEDLIKNTSYMNGVLGTTSEKSGAYIAAALLAGMDLECNLGGGNASVTNGAEAVLEGYITEQQLETNIYHLFLQRFRTGEFDSNPSYRDITSNVIETDENVAVAEQAAEESWVLLKNDSDILPIKDKKNIAVVGNMANLLVLGDYTGTPEKTVKPITGIREAFEADGAEVSYLGEITDDEKLFNLKSMTFIMKDGSRKTIDLTKAEKVSGMTAANGGFTDITPAATAVIKNVNFLNVASVEAELSTGSRVGGSINIAYGQGGPTVASVSTSPTAELDSYTACTGEFTGEDGGYNGTADMYISASARAVEFSVEAYKQQLDAADVIIAYAGTIPKQDGMGDADSSESKDRKNIDLPAHQSHVQTICDAYPEKTVVVMSTVGQINVEPFMNKCKAILWTSYNGQTQGTALGKVLTGDVNPSGRLTTTWYKNADVQKLELSNTEQQKIGSITGKYTNYDIQPTDTKPGNTYQYYNNTPVYPFGYGLSYTSFEYSNMTIDKTEADANGKVTMTVDVKNTGNTGGKEVVQLYVSHPQSNSMTPKKQLKGFEKVELAAGETKTVSFALDVSDMELYSEKLVKNEVPSGTYTAYIGKNADDVSLSKTFNVTGTLDASLKTVKAMPDGISLSAYISEDGSKLSPIYKIKANLSAVMNDESVYDIAKAQVSYASSNEAVATVDEEGTVTSGTVEGTAVITATVTINGVTKTDSFPVVNVLTVANDDIPYVISKVTNQKDGNVDVTLSYRGSVAATDVTLKAEVLNADGSVKSTAKSTVKGADKFSVATGAADGEKVRYTVENSDGKALSESYEFVYNVPIPSKIVTYYLESPDYDYSQLTGGTDGIKYDKTVNGLSGYGSWKLDTKSKGSYTYVDTNDNEYSYDFTKSWSAGSGGKEKRSLYFTPLGEGKVTAVFYGSESIRSMTIQQGSRSAVQEGTGAVAEVSLDITNTAEPVYIYGGSSTKYLYAIIVEYYGMGGTVDPSASPSETSSPEPTSKPKPSGTTYTYTVPEAGIAMAAGTALIDNDAVKVYITNDITTNINDQSAFDQATYSANIPFRGNGIVKAHLDDLSGNNREGAANVAVIPKNDGEFTAAIGINAEKTMRVWDNTDNKEIQTVTSVQKGVSQISAEMKAGHEYLVYAAGTTACILKAEYLAYDKSDVTSSPDATSQPTSSPDATSQPTPSTDVTTSPDTTEQPSDKVTVTYDAAAQVINIDAGSQNIDNAAVIIASYEDGRVASVKTYTAEAVIGNIALNDGDRVMVWDSLNGMTPISDVFVYAAQGELMDIQAVSWNGDNDILLTKDTVSGETKIMQKLIGNQMAELSLDSFYSADESYSYGDKLTVNALAVYKDRLYAACDDGYVVMLTNCIKCYQLKKPVDFDIKSMEIVDGKMTVYDEDGNSTVIDMSELGGDSIEADEANALISNGAVLIDVRSAEEFAEKSVDGSVNIPADEIEEGIAAYDTDAVLIFCCASGARAQVALEKAKELGYTNVYTLGSIDKLI